MSKEAKCIKLKLEEIVELNQSGNILVSLLKEGVPDIEDFRSA